MLPETPGHIIHSFLTWNQCKISPSHCPQTLPTNGNNDRLRVHRLGYLYSFFFPWQRVYFTYFQASIILLNLISALSCFVYHFHGAPAMLGDHSKTNKHIIVSGWGHMIRAPQLQISLQLCPTSSPLLLTCHYLLLPNMLLRNLIASVGILSANQKD